MTRRRLTARAVAAASALVVLSACSGGGSATGAATTEATAPTTTSTATTAAPAPSTTTPPAAPAAPNGRRVPVAASDPTALAQQIVSTERALRDVATPVAARPDLGHLNQVAYRKLGNTPAWDVAVVAAVPADLQPVVRAHAQARRALSALRTDVPGEVPAWEVVNPEPAAQLQRYYREAETATGVPWQYLAAINLVETGFGRIHGLSVSGARGPMQFLPSTWAEPGIGQGNIDDPHDAIQAAARYLVRRGGPADMAKALRGYNNHAEYVTGVSLYADLMRQDERAFAVLYEWEIHYASTGGDLWFPAGYHETVRISVDAYLAKAPWSAPPKS